MAKLLTVYSVSGSTIQLHKNQQVLFCKEPHIKSWKDFTARRNRILMYGSILDMMLF